MTKIFHTVKDQGTPSEIIRQVPFLAEGEMQWFGDGYYFWESFIYNAHWWGNVHYHSSYVICQSTYECTETNCINLIDNAEHLEMMSKLTNELIECKIANPDTKLGRIIMFARQRGILPNSFKAIRASIPNSRSYTNKRYSRILAITVDFCLDLRPQIQVCFFDESLFKKPLSIIYPEQYIDGYVV